MVAPQNVEAAAVVTIEVRIGFLMIGITVICVVICFIALFRSNDDHHQRIAHLEHLLTMRVEPPAIEGPPIDLGLIRAALTDPADADTVEIPAQPQTQPDLKKAASIAPPAPADFVQREFQGHTFTFKGQS